MWRGWCTHWTNASPWRPFRNGMRWRKRSWATTRNTSRPTTSGSRITSRTIHCACACASNSRRRPPDAARPLSFFPSSSPALCGRPNLFFRKRKLDGPDEPGHDGWGAGNPVMATRKLIIDGKEVEAEESITLLQACEEAGAEIPRFCYHERLSIAGNCRMCLVELKGAPKPVASCAWAVRDCRPGPKGEAPEVFTKTPMVRKARNGVMEFLLINHPLDCPICDQGGECDLQDQAMAFGVDSSRFAENKRAVEDKYIGPLVRTSMNRCIHCTRCVRFTAEVAGTSDMGAIGRGEDMEITTYLETAMTSELQGNVADLCPVGALLPKPYSFKARPWELVKTQSVDVMDAVGSAIRVDPRGRDVMRNLPRINDAENEEWISDKTRQNVDGLKTQRLDRPFIHENGRLRAASWGEAFAAIAARVKGTAPDRIGAIAGDLCAVEEMFALKVLMEKLGSRNIDCRQ